MQSKKFAHVLGFIVTFSVAQTHAGLLDDLLKNPTIQGLMGRSDLNTMAAACRDTAYRQANAPQCTNMENALILSRLPNEMRVLMSNAQSASSLREICAAVQGLPQNNSYLCAELRKAELAIGIQVAPPPLQTPAPLPVYNDGQRG